MRLTLVLADLTKPMLVGLRRGRRRGSRKATILFANAYGITPDMLSFLLADRPVSAGFMIADAMGEKSAPRRCRRPCDGGRTAGYSSATSLDLEFGTESGLPKSHLSDERPFVSWINSLAPSHVGAIRSIPGARRADGGAALVSYRLPFGWSEPWVRGSGGTPAGRPFPSPSS